MKIKATWGFKGDPAAVGNAEGRVLAGTVLTVGDEYAHHLIGRGLAKAYGDKEAAAEQAAKDSDGRHAQANSALAARERAVDDQLADLQNRENALSAAHDELRLRGEELDAREADVARREQDLLDADGKDGDGNGKPGAAPKKAKPAAPAETK